MVLIRSDSNSSLGMGFLGSSKFVLPPPVVARLLVLITNVVRLLVFKAARKLGEEREMGIRQVKMP